METSLPAPNTRVLSPGGGGDWTSPLVQPERARLVAITRDLPGAPSPRAHFGAALALLVAQAYGTRRWLGGARAAVAVVEAIDRRIHEDAAASTVTWVREDASHLRRVWDAVFKNETVLLDRVLDRVVGTEVFGERPIPEAVLFLRGAVAAGVLAGAVDDANHRSLDALATGLGLCLEAAYGTLPRERERGLALAREALAALPDGLLVERVTEVLERLPAHLVDARAFRGYAPRPVPRPAQPLEDAFSVAMVDVFGPAGSPLVRASSWLVGQGGKRVRPAMVQCAALACGGSAADAQLPGALLEWLHQSSLVIDDMLDEARIRRGLPTLHHATDVPFASVVAAYALARVAITSRALAPPLRRALHDAATTLAEGQRAELAHTADDQLPVSVYYRVIEAKTARLFACAAALGARCANAKAPVVQALARYGREAGLAFQIVDDVLDFFGDEHDLGKRPGTDLRAGKVTLPLLLLRDRLDANGRETLAAVLRSDPEARRTAFPWVLERMRALGIEADCLSRAGVHRDRAVAALDVLPPGPDRDALVALADRLVARRR